MTDLHTSTDPTHDLDRLDLDHPDLSVLSAGGGRRKVVNRVMTVVLGLTAVLALIPLVLIVFVTIREGARVFGWEFITTDPPFSRRSFEGGFYSGLVGTGLMVGMAALLAIPLGVLAAVFLVEYKTSRLAGPVRFFTDVMTGVPSVFVGLFVYALFVQDLGLGFSAVAGGIALAIIMLPIVVRTCEEIIKLVPSELRNAAYGLGARQWQVIVKVVLPSASSGITTACMLAVARAAGETAPLILTAFGAFGVTYAVTGEPIAALPLQIFENITQPFPAAQAKAWAGALELMLIVLIFTVLARLVGRRAARVGQAV